jgi:hypothetical protein
MLILAIIYARVKKSRPLYKLKIKSNWTFRISLTALVAFHIVDWFEIFFLKSRQYRQESDCG